MSSALAPFRYTRLVDSMNVMKVVPQVAVRVSNDRAFQMQAWRTYRIALGLNVYRNAGGNILLLFMPVRVLGHLVSGHDVARSRDQFVLTVPRISRTRTTYITLAKLI